MFRFYFLRTRECQCNEWLSVIYFLRHQKFIVTIQSIRVYNLRPYKNIIVFNMGINKVFQCLPYAKYFKGPLLNILEGSIELINVERRDLNDLDVVI